MSSTLAPTAHDTGLPPKVVPISAKIPWDVAGFNLSDDGKYLAYVTNEDGIFALGSRPVDVLNVAPTAPVS